MGLHGQGLAVGAGLAAAPLVLMATEGGYPYYRGGVSVWCDRLIRDLPNVSFALMSFVGSPRIDPLYPLPRNVRSCAKVPLWGIREVLESSDTLTLTELRRRRRETTDAVVRRVFLPSFRTLLAELYEERASLDRLAQAIRGLHRFFLRYDFDSALRSRATWQCFVDASREQFAPAAARIELEAADCSLADVNAAMTLLYRWLIPIANPLPRADLVHATSVGLPSLAAIAAKLENGSPVLLTEHGVFLRERCLQEFQTPSSPLVKLLSIRFALHITALSYAVADQISPGSNYNQRWELHGGAQPEQLATIYNGVDPGSFRPAEPHNATPLVVWIGRITPVKDLKTLIHAAALVRAARPDVRFALFGAAADGDRQYYDDCVALVRLLGLERVVEFRGYVPSAEAALNEGDVVVMSSISEGFPYSVIEAMLCEKPVVATAVGGVPEAIKGCGIAVEPRNPDALAKGILRLIDDPELRRTMGKAARKRAASRFNIRQCAAAYEESYRRLAASSQPTTERVHAPSPLWDGPSHPPIRSIPGPEPTPLRVRRELHAEVALRSALEETDGFGPTDEGERAAATPTLTLEQATTRTTELPADDLPTPASLESGQREAAASLNAWKKAERERVERELADEQERFHARLMEELVAFEQQLAERQREHEKLLAARWVEAEQLAQKRFAELESSTRAETTEPPAISGGSPQ